MSGYDLLYIGASGGENLRMGAEALDEDLKETRSLSILEAIGEALLLEMERDDRVVLLGMDVGRLGGVFRVTRGLQQRFGLYRVCDMPLAEGAIVGASLGLAIGGLVPVAEIQFLGFTHQALQMLDLLHILLPLGENERRERIARPWAAARRVAVTSSSLPDGQPISCITGCRLRRCR